MAKIGTVIDTIKLIKNWPTNFAEYFGMIKQGHIVYILRNGIRYKVRAGTYDRKIIDELFIRKTYTREDFGIGEDDLVVDVGAHIGTFTIMASRLARKGKVYAFEPMPENFALLKDNVEINAAHNVVVINKAVASRKGRKKLFVCTENTGGHSFYGGGRKGRYVKTTTLEDFVKEYSIGRE